MLLQAFVTVGIDHCVIFMVASWSMIGNVPDGDDIEDGRKKKKRYLIRASVELVLSIWACSPHAQALNTTNAFTNEVNPPAKI